MQQAFDWNLAIFVLMAIQALSTAAVFIHSWFDRRRRATRQEIADVNDRCDKISQRLDDHRVRLTSGEARFVQIEKDLARLPNSQAIGELELAMERLGGKLDVMNQRLDGAMDIQEMIKGQVERIDTFLRDNK